MKPGALAAVFIALAASLLSHVAAAHDYWLEPASTGEGRLELRMFLGDSIVVEEEKALDPKRTTRFRRHSASTMIDLLPAITSPAKPAYRAELPRAEYLFEMERSSARLELEAEKFTAYLKEEGLDAIVDERARRGETSKPGRERYTRHLKAVIGGGLEASLARERIGHRFEIVAEGPLEPGKELPVRAWFEGAPVRGVKLELFSRDAKGKIERAQATTTADGRAKLAVTSGAIHLVRAVHMIRCKKDCADVDWDSAWTSLTIVR